MASTWIDVSVTLRNGMVSWPGDPPARVLVRPVTVSAERSGDGDSI